MNLTPEEIRIININDDSQTMRDIIIKENLIVLLLDLIKTSIEPVFGTIDEIEIRKDLLKSVRKEDLILAIGGNKNPASVWVMNLYNNNNKICLLLSCQKQAAPTNDKNRLIDKIKRLFWHE